MGAHDGHISGMLRSAFQAANAEIVGIVEPDDDCYQKACRGREIPRYPTLDDMIADARPELIIEGLNHFEKLELVEKAAAAGAHLLLDKPLCLNFEHLERMERAVRQAGIKVSMWFTSRDYKPFVKLRQHILAGDLGELVSFVSTHPHKLWPEHPQWYWDPGKYTGVFHDLACHGVDQIRWLSGAEYTGVHALAAVKKYKGTTLVDHIQASFQLSDGACGVVTADWLTPKDSPSFGDTRFIIMGTEGSAHLRAYAGDHLLIVSNKKGVLEPSFDDVPSRPFVQEMIESIERGEEPFITTQDVFAVARACLTAEESAKRGGVFLPIQNS